MYLLDEKERVKEKLQKLEEEKNYYLGEFKENIIAAIEDKDLNEENSEEILKLLKDKNVKLLKINRKIKLEKVRKYIKFSEKIGLNYRLVDGISFLGNIGMVIVSKEILKTNEKESIIFENKEKQYLKKGLPSLYAKNEGKKICEKHFEILKKKYPEKCKRFFKINFLDRLFGKKCPVCKGEKNNECRGL